MATGSPFRPPSDGERSEVKVTVSLSARAANGLEEMREFLGLDKLSQVLRKALVFLELAIKGVREGKELCFRDPKTGEFEVIRFK